MNPRGRPKKTTKSEPTYKKVLGHPDVEEILSKLIIDTPIKEIGEWLKSKYSSVGEQNLIISDKMLKDFKDQHLDFYQFMQEDLSKAKQALTQNRTIDDLPMLLDNNSAYKLKIQEMANTELDVRKMIVGLTGVIEQRLGAMFDAISMDPTVINSRLDRLLIEYARLLGEVLEKYYRITEMPAAQTTMNANVNITVINDQVSVIIDAIKETLSLIDVDASMQFIELFNDKMSKLQLPTASASLSPEMKMAEAKLLNETIGARLNA